MKDLIRTLGTHAAGGALALALLAGLSTPASAQRHHSRTDWQVGVSKETRRGGIGVTVGSRGISVNAHRNGAYGRRGRVTERVARPVGRFDRSGGRYEIRHERVWVPGTVRRIWHPAEYATHYDSCGRPYQVLIRAGFHDTVQDPGYYRTVERRVWVPARSCGISAY